MNPSEIVAEVIRNDKVESVHRGYIAVASPDGTLVASVGDPEHWTYIRSAAKPFQIMPLFESGAVEHFGFTDKELAVMIASHNGEPIHVEAVRSIHEKTGLTADHLQCGLHTPMHKPTALALRKRGSEFNVFHNNCSGKHSGMLVTALYQNHPVDSYLEPTHPVQISIKEKVSQFSDVAFNDVHVGVDGCSAPVFYLPVKGMALMYARLAAGTLPHTRRIFDVMSQNPEMIAGTDRFDTDLMRAMQGYAVSKVGAEGVQCIGIRGARPLGIALKIEDGSPRGSEAVVLALLEKLNLISPDALSLLEAYRQPQQVNHSGRVTGCIRPSFECELS